MKGCDKNDLIKTITNIIMDEDVNDLSKTLNKVAMVAQKWIRCDSCTIWLYHEKKEQLTLKGASERHKIGNDKFFYRKNDGLTWHVYQEKQIINRKDAATMKDWHGKYLKEVYTPDELAQMATKGGAFLGVPIMFRKICLGVLAFGSVIVPKKFNDRDSAFAKAIANEIAMAFNRQSENLEQASLRIERLQFTSEFSNSLLASPTFDKIYSVTTQTIRKWIDCRTVSMFFFSKNGLLERKYIAGFRKENEPTSESYKRGQGLAGFAVKSSDGFGAPYRCNDISNEDKIQSDPVVMRYAINYEVALKREYGNDETLNHVIAIPLNGKNRTFGVLRIINKVDISANKLSETGFTKIDEEWLILIASFVSSAIANIKKQIRQDSIFAIHHLISLDDENEFYNTIAKKIAHDETNCYSLCAIYKLKESEDEFILVGYSEDINASNPQLTLGKEFASKIRSLKQLQMIANITLESNYFTNPEQAKKSGYVSMICLPLQDVKTQTIYGAFSIFTKFYYTFDQVDIDYLTRLTDQISLVINLIQERINKNLVIEQLQRNEIIKDIVSQIPTRNNLEICYKEIIHQLIDRLKANIGLITLLSKESNRLEAACLDDISKDQYSNIIYKTAVGEQLLKNNIKETILLLSVDSELDKIYIPIKKDIKSELIAPMVYHAEIIGFIHIGSDKEKAFDNKDKIFLQTMANVVAVIIQNKRFHAAALRLGKVYFDNMDSLAICNSLARYACEIMETPLTCVLTIEKIDEKESLTLQGWHSKEEHDKVAFCIENKNSISWKLIEKIRKSNNPFHDITEIEEDSPDKNTICFQLAMKFGMKRILSMPIMTNHEVIGIINTYSKSKLKFFEEEINLLKNLAINAAFALKNADLSQKNNILNDELLDIAQLANPGIVALSFTHNMAHIIDSIAAKAYRLSKQLSGDNQSLINKIIENSDYLIELFHTLTSYSGSKNIEVTPNKIIDIVKRVKRLVEPRLIRNKIQLSLYIPNELIVNCYSDLIEQVFINLFNNSIYAIKEKQTETYSEIFDLEHNHDIDKKQPYKGLIELSASASEQDFIKIDFKDNGIGISKDNLERILKFNFTTKGKKGSGAGLITSKRIVTGIHNGKIQVESEYMKHTLITIQLPKTMNKEK